MKSAIKVVILFFLASSLCFSEGENILTRVSLDQATQQILSMANHKVLGATTEILEGKEVHIIKVLDADGWIKFYKIDAETGILIS
ncbi:PepSY domain-containing protein [Crenothrix sp.]|uniref:PepSY domain-containing protein n=1 Tax=Crenothrix sp. TaxID=3100433 RepID=UPI00374D1588